jgi:PIN domain nuclease of toxin-antitoxin system
LQLKSVASIHLDSHVVCWLYAGVVHLLSESASEYLEKNELKASPAVVLELQRWHEKGLILVPPQEIVEDLSRRIGLTVAPVDLLTLVKAAAAYPWASDPFDRLIIAHAALVEAPLLTKDAAIHARFPQAIW